MGIEFLNDFMIPVIIGICLLVGYVVKHWVKDVNNRIIPTLCAVLGVLLAVWMNDLAITPEIILSGLASGLASTGLHQAVKQLIGEKSEVKN